MGHMILATLALALCTIATPLTSAQPDDAGRPITKVFNELSETYGGRALAGIGNTNHDGMQIIDGWSLSANRTLAMLSVEHAYIERVMAAAAVAVYTLPAYEPIDPFQEVSPALDDSAMFRRNARILDYDSMRCWMDGDFNGSLDRVAGMLQLAYMLADTGDSMALLTGSAIEDLAQSRLDAMAEAIDGAAEGPVLATPTFNRARALVDARPRLDPIGAARMASTTLRRGSRWMRGAFTGEGHTDSYSEYLLHYARSDDALLKHGARVAGLTRDPQFLLTLTGEDPPNLKEQKLQKLWDELTPGQRAAAYARARELMEESEWWPTDAMPRLYADDPDQSPGETRMSELLARVDHLANDIERAQNRGQIRDALTAIRIEMDLDRSQVTRICANVWGTAGLMHWRQSIKRHDEILAALHRLEEHVSADE